MRRRVVITGIGLVTPIGLDQKSSFGNLIEGTSGIKPFDSFDASGLRTRFGGEVRGFDVTKYLTKPEERRTDRFSQLAIAASDEAMRDSGFSIPESMTNQVG